MDLIDRSKLHSVSVVDGINSEGVITTRSFWASDVANAPTVDAIPMEWVKNKREELEKEYYDSFYGYTDEGMNKQVRLLNGDFRAFDTVLGYWERENELEV